MAEFDRDTLVGLLKNNSLKVTFTKKDGTSRDMICTLQEDQLPKQEVKENAKPRAVNLDVIRVFDLEKKAWRSFRIDSIKTFQLDNEIR